jgi:endonuclease/exonuclease/phosphatase family metal-dependent hydrolase
MGMVKCWNRLLFVFFFSIVSITSRAQSKLLWEQHRYRHFQSSSGTPSQSAIIYFQVANPEQPLVVSAPVAFEVSADGINFSRFAIYDLDKLRAGRQSLFVRFYPKEAINGFLDTLQLTGAATWSGHAFYLHGSTLPESETLDLVNWNIQWFGSRVAGFGPDNDDLAQSNIRKVMDSLDADVYAFSEVVDTFRFHQLIKGLPGYQYLITDYCSGSAGNQTAAYAAGQKLAFVYRKSVIRSIQARPLLWGSLAAKVNWANGRFPWLIEAATAGAAGKNLHFVLLHGKSGILETDHQKRKEAARELKDTLDSFFKDKSLILLGDFNDDLDTAISIGSPSQPSSYDEFVSDSTGEHHYASISDLLSKTGSRSMISYPDPIDHLLISDELKEQVIRGAVRVVYEVKDWVKNYSTTTSDHFPVLSRFKWPQGVVTSISNLTYAIPSFEVKQSGNQLIISGHQSFGIPGYEILSIAGQRLIYHPEKRSGNGSFQLETDLSFFPEGIYIVRIFLKGRTRSMRIFIHP